jgi:hypothetical protein
MDSPRLGGLPVEPHPEQSDATDATNAELKYLSYSAEYHQAVGMVVAALSVDPRQAHEWLDAQAEALERDVAALSKEIVRRSLRPHPAGLFPVPEVDD